MAGCNNDSPTEQKIVEHVTVQSVKIPESVQSGIANNEIKNAQKEDQTVITDYLDSMQTQESLSQNLLSAIKTAPLPSESRDTSYTDLINYSEELQEQIAKMTKDLQNGSGSGSISFVRTPGKITDIPDAKGVELTIPLISINATITQKQSLVPPISINNNINADIKTASSIFISDLKEFSDTNSDFKNLRISEEISNSINANITITMNDDASQPETTNTGKALYNTEYTLGGVFVVPATEQTEKNIAGKLVGEITIKLNIDAISTISDDDFMSNLTNPNFELYETLPQEYFEISKIKFIVYDLNGNELFTYKEINSISDFSKDPFAKNVLQNLIDFQNSITNPDSTTEE